MWCVLGCNCAVGISFLQSFHVRSRGSLFCWDQSTEVAQNMGHALSSQHVTHFTFWALIFCSSRLLSLRRNQKDLEIRQERSPLLKLLQDWTQVKCCARMSGIVWVCKQVASGAALVGSCFQLRERKKTLKTSLHTSNFARNILTFIASTKQCQKQRHRFSGGEKHLCDNARFL